MGALDPKNGFHRDGVYRPPAGIRVDRPGAGGKEEGPKRVGPGGVCDPNQLGCICKLCTYSALAAASRQLDLKTV